MAYYIVLSIGLVVSLMFCIKRRKGFSVSNLMFKSVSSLCYLLTAAFALVMNSSANIYGSLIIFGGALGLVGDISLDLKGRKYIFDRRIYLLFKRTFVLFRRNYLFHKNEMVDCFDLSCRFNRIQLCKCCNVKGYESAFRRIQKHCIWLCYFPFVDNGIGNCCRFSFTF